MAIASALLGLLWLAALRLQFSSASAAATVLRRPSSDLPRKPPVSFMIVGDSISQGAQGDWTWRYRIWEWLQAEGVSANFVGPYTGTRPPDPPEPPQPPPLLEGAPTSEDGPPDTNGGYAVGAKVGWDSAHFSVWGRTCWEDELLIQEMVTNHPSDFILFELGFNDLAWGFIEPEEVLRCMHSLVTISRAVNPNLKFVIANVPQRTDLPTSPSLPVNTDLYNELLARDIPLWSTSTSPVSLVQFRENYSCELDGCPASHDGLHPNALGEYEIAQAFSRVLVSDFSIGSNELVIPLDIPDRPCPVPSNLAASTDGMTVTWDAVYGAFLYDIEYRLDGVTEWSSSMLTFNRFDLKLTIDGWKWEYRVRTNNDLVGKSDWSNPITAISKPQTANEPNNVTAIPTATGFNLTWEPPIGENADNITVYAILFYDSDIPGSFFSGYSVPSTTLSCNIDKLKAGHAYLIVVQAWNEHGGGKYGLAEKITIGENVSSSVVPSSTLHSIPTQTSSPTLASSTTQTPLPTLVSSTTQTPSSTLVFSPTLAPSSTPSPFPKTESAKTSSLFANTQYYASRPAFDQLLLLIIFFLLLIAGTYLPSQRDSLSTALPSWYRPSETASST